MCWATNKSPRTPPRTTDANFDGEVGQKRTFIQKLGVGGVPFFLWQWSDLLRWLSCIEPPVRPSWQRRVRWRPSRRELTGAHPWSFLPHSSSHKNSSWRFSQHCQTRGKGNTVHCCTYTISNCVNWDSLFIFVFECPSRFWYYCHSDPQFARSCHRYSLWRRSQRSPTFFKDFGWSKTLKRPFAGRYPSSFYNWRCGSEIFEWLLTAESVTSSSPFHSDMSVTQRPQKSQ